MISVTTISVSHINAFIRMAYHHIANHACFYKPTHLCLTENSDLVVLAKTLIETHLSQFTKRINLNNRRIDLFHYMVQKDEPIEPCVELVSFFDLFSSNDVNMCIFCLQKDESIKGGNLVYYHKNHKNTCCCLCDDDYEELGVQISQGSVILLSLHNEELIRFEPCYGEGPLTYMVVQFY